MYLKQAELSPNLHDAAVQGFSMEEQQSSDTCEAKCDSLQVQEASLASKLACKCSISEETTCLSQPILGLCVTR